MNAYVNICFEIADNGECDRIFACLAEHPKDIWNYEERVKQNSHLNFHTHWTDEDILYTEVTRLKVNDDVSMIEYKVTLKQGAKDPRLLVDLLSRCKNVQEGNMSGKWTRGRSQVDSRRGQQRPADSSLDKNTSALV